MTGTVPVSSLPHAIGEYRSSWRSKAGGQDLLILTMFFTLLFTAAWTTLLLTEGLRERIVEAMTGRFGTGYYPLALSAGASSSFRYSMWERLADPERFSHGLEELDVVVGRDMSLSPQHEALFAAVKPLGQIWPMARLTFSDLGVDVVTMRRFGLDNRPTDAPSLTGIAIDRQDPFWRWIAEEAGGRSAFSEPGQPALVLNRAALDWWRPDGYSDWLAEVAPDTARATDSGHAGGAPDGGKAKAENLFEADRHLHLPIQKIDAADRLLTVPVHWVQSLPLGDQPAFVVPSDAAGSMLLDKKSALFSYVPAGRDGAAGYLTERATIDWPASAETQDGRSYDAIARRVFDCLVPDQATRRTRTSFEPGLAMVRFGSLVPGEMVDGCRRSSAPWPPELNLSADRTVTATPVTPVNGFLARMDCSHAAELSQLVLVLGCGVHSGRQPGREESSLVAFDPKLSEPSDAHLYAASRGALLAGFDLITRFGADHGGRLFYVPPATEVTGERLKFLLGVVDWAAGLMLVALAVGGFAICYVQCRSLMEHKAAPLLVLMTMGLPYGWIYRKIVASVAIAAVVGAVVSLGVTYGVFRGGNYFFRKTEAAQVGIDSIGLVSVDVFQMPSVALIAVVLASGVVVVAAALAWAIRRSGFTRSIEPIDLSR